MAIPTPTDAKPEVYTDIAETETPAVVVDLDVMESNIADYADFAAAQSVALRSHTKTHKIPALAHQQNEATGGDGIVCQTLSEAEVMAHNGIRDIYLSYMVVGDHKLNRLIQLSNALDRFTTTVDGPGNIHPLQAAAARHDATVEVVLEIDIGLNRVGVDPGHPAVEMARRIAEQENLQFGGVMAYEGHIGYGDNRATTDEEFYRRCRAAMDEVERTVDRIEAEGIPVADVKVGSTATSKYSAQHEVVTEINPGMYPFMDANLLAVPHITKADCALTVLTTVISNPTADRVVVDAGSKSISLELDVPPEFAGDDAVSYYNASEEHGWIDMGDATRDFGVGDRLGFIPPHVCPTINLHDTLIGVRDGAVETVWSVQGRGKVK